MKNRLQCTKTLESEAFQFIGNWHRNIMANQEQEPQTGKKRTHRHYHEQNHHCKTL